MNSAYRIGLFIGIVGPSLGCRTIDGGSGDASTVKYGFLDQSSLHLINFQSGSTIPVCGPYFEYVKWAINTWGFVINRSYNVVSQCGTADGVKVLGATDEFASQQCAQQHIEGRAYAVPDYHPQLIVDCGGIAANPATAILHEVGHLFGLCDQYEESIGNCVYNHGVVVGSVMNAGNSTELTADDIEGIRALAAQTDGGGNTGTVPPIQPPPGQSGVTTDCPALGPDATTDELIERIRCLLGTLN